MTNEEAIRKLESQKLWFLEEYVDYSGISEAYDMAINALKDKSPNMTKEEACFDLVFTLRSKRLRIPPLHQKEEKVYPQREVAELLSEAIGDGCACNVNGNDEWLPFVCECTDKCPSPGGVECWVQYLKHLDERFDVLEKEWGEK